MQMTVMHVAVVLVAFLASDGKPLGRENALKEFVQKHSDASVERWVQGNYEKAITELLPSGIIAADKFPSNVQWAVTVRILPPFEKPEYRLHMQKTHDGRVEASVTTPSGKSINSQLRILRTKHPRSPVERIISMIAIQHRTLTEAQQPELARLAKEFEMIKMSPVLPDELGVDETSYELWSQSLWGNRVEIRLGGPGSDVEKQPHPILEWAESFRRMTKLR